MPSIEPAIAEGRRARAAREDRVSESDVLGKESELRGEDTEPDTKQTKKERLLVRVFINVFLFFTELSGCTERL